MTGTEASRLWLEVPDARAAAKALAAAGVTAVADPFPVATGWTVEVADPWGNIVGFTDYTTMPERGRPA
jgi:predicted enzyme related to lactoylglutathione lyase